MDRRAFAAGVLATAASSAVPSLPSVASPEKTIEETFAELGAPKNTDCCFCISRRGMRELGFDPLAPDVSKLPNAAYEHRIYSGRYGDWDDAEHLLVIRPNRDGVYDPDDALKLKQYVRLR